MRAIDGSNRPPSAPHGALQPTIEDVPDEHDRLAPALARASTLDRSLHPSRAPSAPQTPYVDNYPPPSAASNGPGASSEDFYGATGHADVSPIEDGGYFPDVLGPEPVSPPAQHPPSPFWTGPPPGDVGQPQHPVELRTLPTFPSALASRPPQVPDVLSYHTLGTGASAGTQALPQPSPAAFVPDEEAIAKAQKHARWAISALNFEDVPTAIKELREALATLGAR